MIKTKPLDVRVPNAGTYPFNVDYEAENGEILAVYIDGIDILPIINESVLNRIIDVFNGSFNGEG